MFCKAIFICEDVRFEVHGTMTLVGVHGEKLLVPAGEPTRFGRLYFVTVVGGLTGHSRVAYSHTLRSLAANTEPPIVALREEAHDPTTDEHSFVFGDSPMEFPGPGSYELETVVEAGGRAQFRYKFKVEHAAPMRPPPV